ncbi:hypothetical protein GBAR_LOCUS31329, partial [Geodia barretti]
PNIRYTSSKTAGKSAKTPELCPKTLVGSTETVSEARRAWLQLLYRTYIISLQGPALSDENSWFPLKIMVARATIVCGNTGMEACWATGLLLGSRGAMLYR